ncbi:nucleotide pyrophosphohydrolase [Cellulomonas humilata]|uniref:Nucleotide pyrophosphohydrolase n=1 Tax=Cellulomonas humilata TaxID=144055 RepID=A0A7Y6A4U5_9CELL|nr:nucleotide pyrophosphohydrolase [Cellulomonas humilata]NUU18469.1 nucleotide pyrophosphohydrolase [Cellulomonas humilata]
MVDPKVRAEPAAFVAQRDWAQFHTPENLTKCIAIEAGELLECFQWVAEADPDQIRTNSRHLILDKLLVTRAKYPAKKARGRSTKYDQL